MSVDSFDDPAFRELLVTLLMQSAEIVRLSRPIVTGRRDRVEWVIDDLDAASDDLFRAWKLDSLPTVLRGIREVRILLDVFGPEDTE